MIPLRRVLAAVDFSDPSRTALVFASRLAAQSRAELHVLHAQDPLLAAAAAARGFDLVRDTHRELDAFAHAAGAANPTLHVVTGSPAAAVCDIAVREHADVIVIGAHGMSGPEHVVFGSVAEGVIRRTATSVLVVPACWTPPDATRGDLLGSGPIVAATDLCLPSIEAARAAGDLAALLHTTLEVVHVIPELAVIDRWKAHADDALERQRQVVQGQMQVLVNTLHAPVPVVTRVETGRLAECLAAVAEPAGTRRPVLVLGRRAETSRAGAPGSTAYRVLILAQVPVLVHLSEER